MKLLTTFARTILVTCNAPILGSNRNWFLYFSGSQTCVFYSHTTYINCKTIVSLGSITILFLSLSPTRLPNSVEDQSEGDLLHER